MKHSFTHLRIRAIAAAIPRQRLNLRELGARHGREEVERIIATTGIESVRVAPPGVCASDLCVAAAQGILNATGILPSAIDAVVFISQTPDYRLPATSATLQHRLGLPQDALAFDLNSGCAGYIYGLLQAALLLTSGCCRRVLVLAGDTTTRLIHPDDKSVRMVFGDAGSATLVDAGAPEGEAAAGPLHLCLKTDGGGAPFLMVPAGGFRQPADPEAAAVRDDGNGNRRAALDLFMDGMEILNFSMREVPPAVDNALALAGWNRQDTGAFILHQANRFMVEYLRRKMQLPSAAVPVTMKDTGNTGPASIPLALALDHSRLAAEQRLQRCVLCGFGSGLAWGAAAVDLSQTLILDPLETA